MASTINNYATLKTAIINWLDRADISGNVPDFIALAEDTILGDLNLVDQEKLTPLTFDPAVNGAIVALPADCIAVRQLTWMGKPLRSLTYLTPAQVTWEYGDQTPGAPRAYTVAQGNIQLANPPDLAYTVNLLYTAGLPPLSDTNQTNWLILRDASMYLYGSLLHAAPFLGDDARVQLWSAAYQASRENVALYNERRKYGGAPLTMRTDWAP